MTAPGDTGRAPRLMGLAMHVAAFASRVAGHALHVPRLALPLSAMTLAALALAAFTGSARAQDAPGDSLLHAYVRSLSDTTDAWFRESVAPLDTAGLDSALAAGLARPPGARRASGQRRAVRLGWSPALGFQRADGAALGLETTLRSSLPGRLSGRAQWTTGTHDVLGEGAWSGSWSVPRLRSRLSLRAAAGRWSEPFDRDDYDPVWATLYAVLYGGDRHQYLRRDGFRAELRASGERGAASVGWRDQLESEIPYTTDWTLLGWDPVLAYNAPPAPGRARELSFGADADVPGTRFRVSALYATSDPRLGSDFRYRRLRASAGGDVSLGRHLALVPQATYGRLRGEVPPQEAFFFGGAPNVRTLDRNQLAGSGRTFARADLILVDDLGRLLHLPTPAWLPLQAGAFAASGASWGHDATGLAAAPTRRDAPRANEWRSEVGAALGWRIGLPDPLSSLRLEYALPVGADGRDARFTLFYQRPVFVMGER